MVMRAVLFISTTVSMPLVLNDRSCLNDRLDVDATFFPGEADDFSQQTVCRTCRYHSHCLMLQCLGFFKGHSEQLPTLRKTHRFGLFVKLSWATNFFSQVTILWELLMVVGKGSISWFGVMDNSLKISYRIFWNPLPTSWQQLFFGRNASVMLRYFGTYEQHKYTSPEWCNIFYSPTIQSIL